MKVVCIGQPKTGTKTISKIFSKLNFVTNSNPLCFDSKDDYILLDNDIKYYISDTIEKAHENIVFFEAFHDYPYSFEYEYIYTHFPDSKFVLTLRNSEEWFNSLFTYQTIPGASNEDIICKLYGYKIILLENKEEIITKYNTYNDNVQNYFKNKLTDLLVINIMANDNNEELRKIGMFLDKVIDFDMPHENKQ